MTPKEKAEELVEKFHQLDFREWIPANYKLAVKCALIAVDQVSESIPKYVSMEEYGRAMFENPDIDFRNQVKTELESL